MQPSRPTYYLGTLGIDGSRYWHCPLIRGYNFFYYYYQGCNEEMTEFERPLIRQSHCMVIHFGRAHFKPDLQLHKTWESPN